MSKALAKLAKQLGVSEEELQQFMGPIVPFTEYLFHGDASPEALAEILDLARQGRIIHSFVQNFEPMLPDDEYLWDDLGGDAFEGDQLAIIRDLVDRGVLVDENPMPDRAITHVSKVTIVNNG